MITIMVFASGASVTLKQLSEVTVRGVMKSTMDGVIQLDLPTPATYNVIVKSAGYRTFQGDLTFGTYTRLVDVTLTKEVPAPEGYMGNCWLEIEYLSFGTFYNVRHSDLGIIKGGYSERSQAEYYAHIDDRCFKHYPPPPTQEEIITRNVLGRVQSQIDGAITAALSPIQSLVNGIPSMINSIVTTALAPVIASIIALKVWIEEQIITIMIRALDKEVKEMK